VLDRLERGGWVRRTSDPGDRRRVVVEIVPGQAERVEEMTTLLQPLVEEMDAINDRYDDDQLQVILDWLRAANDAVERSIARLRG
jgi:DNA-binding MarR family transcriptional regulator